MHVLALSACHASSTQWLPHENVVQAWLILIFSWPDDWQEKSRLELANLLFKEVTLMGVGPSPSKQALSTT